MTDTGYKKSEPMRFFYGFRIKLTVFMALTNCFFVKILWTSCVLFSFLMIFVVQ